MLKRVLLLMALVLPLPVLAQARWLEGKHYITLQGSHPAETRPGKVEVAEVFSYGCIYCYRAQAEAAKLKAALPADAYMTYVHAAFAPGEAWPMYQRAYYTAVSMGIAEANHHDMFSAVWETDEVPLMDKKTNRVRNPLPTIQEAARFYARVGKVKEADFIKTSTSFSVETQIQRANQLIASWRAGSTPSIVVNGRYLVNNEVVTNWDDIRNIVSFLITQERQRVKAAH